MVNLWTEDDFRLIENASTGRRAMVWPSGSVEERGSTGMRNITGLCVDGVVASGFLLLDRIGSEVSLVFRDLVLATGDGTTNVNLITQGAALTQFRPKQAQAVTHKANSAGHVERLAVSTEFIVQVNWGLAGYAINAQVKWSTEAGWPSTLPGVAYGQPVGL